MGQSGMANLISSDGTTSQAAVGQLHESKGNVYQYTKATATVTQYQFCQLDDSGFCAPMTTTTATSTGAFPAGGGPAQFAVASGEFFWLPVGPFRITWDNSTLFYVLGAASLVKDTLLYSTGTAGVLDDTSAGSTILVAGLYASATLTGAAAVACIASRKITLGA